jgi:hypothetical protein
MKIILTFQIVTFLCYSSEDQIKSAKDQVESAKSVIFEKQAIVPLEACPLDKIMVMPEINVTPQIPVLIVPKSLTEVDP